MRRIVIIKVNENNDSEEAWKRLACGPPPCDLQSGPARELWLTLIWARDRSAAGRTLRIGRSGRPRPTPAPDACSRARGATRVQLKLANRFLRDLLLSMDKQIRFSSVTFACAFTLVSTVAFARANFSGHWVAQSGSVSSNVGLSSKCSKVEIVIEQSETSLVTKKYESTCDLYGSTWGPVQEDFIGDQVLEQGTPVGKITDDTLITVAPDGTAEYAFNLRLKKDASGEVVLESYYGVRNSVGAIATEAILHRVP